MIARDVYLNRMRGFLNQPELVKVITGIRRCGKSVMLELIRQELLKQGVAPQNTITLNFEDLGLSELKDYRKLHDHIRELAASKNGRRYLFLDEIQEVDGWEKAVNSLRATMDTDIYITGSNAKMLSGEYATHLSGRYVELMMLPFSFAEYLLARKQREPELSQEQHYRRFLELGGLPLVTTASFTRAEARQYLRDVFSSVIIKDIVKRNAFRNVDLLERVISYVIANIGQTFSANSIANFFKSERRTVAPETILNYLKACEDAYLIYRVERFDVPSKRQLRVDEKYYLADLGLREAVYGNNERDIERVLENLVFLELKRRGFEVMVCRVGAQEVDFIALRNTERIYVQVSYLLASQDTIKREFGALASINDNYPKYLVSADTHNLSRDGIVHYHIKDFLTAETW